MNMTQTEIDRLSYMSRIAAYTDESNRAYHHAMINAGWMPVVGTVGIMRWTNKSRHASMAYQAAMKFHNENGQAPPPF